MTLSQKPSQGAMNSPEAAELIRFIEASPTPFHAVQECVSRLSAAGFTELQAQDSWPNTPDSRHYLVYGGGTLIAFVRGTESEETYGWRVVAAHTDSPNLRIAPQPDGMVAGNHVLRVAVYGGVLLHTWLDRDLGLAGRVFFRTSTSSKALLQSALVDLRRPILRVPNLAIHLQREISETGLALNPAKHLTPLWDVDRGTELTLRQVLAERLREETQLPLQPSDILSWDLSCYDLQPATFLGVQDAYVSAPRLDNLASCHAAIQALVHSSTSTTRHGRIIVLFDHEECGSRSSRGAASSLLQQTLRRLAGPHVDSWPRAMASSFVVSVDMAHAVHPNYGDRHDAHHAPLLGHGPVAKTNANLSYATDGASLGQLMAVAESAGVKLQHFSMREDLRCGSTIGPFVAADLGAPTVDIGNPMLAMHSCRELAAVADVKPMQQLLSTFFGTHECC